MQRRAVTRKKFRQVFINMVNFSITRAGSKVRPRAIEGHGERPQCR